MIEKITKKPVNWIDGMKINKSHFIAMQDYVADSQRDGLSIFCNSLNYGLSPVSQSFDINVLLNNHNQVEVHLTECQAITPNGARISINPKLNEQISQKFAIEDYQMEGAEQEEFLVCISVNLFKHIPTGEADMEEIPPRLPYTHPEYKLHLYRNHELNTLANKGFVLILGKLHLGINDIVFDEAYIPPSVSAQSHPKLTEAYFEILRFYGQIELYGVQIIQKIHIKKQNNLLAKLVEIIYKQTIYDLSREINSFKTLANNAPPAHMYLSVVGMVRILKNTIDTYSGIGKEELLNYFTTWCNVPQGEFEKTFAECINVDYDHNKIHEIHEKIMRFIAPFEELSKILSQLDYIGKNRDGSVFVSEISPETENDISQPKRNRTFLAD